MSTIGLVVAGGRGERMRRSGADRPKPLVEVAGTSLVQHNVAALCRSGIGDVTVAVAADAPDVVRHVDTACRALADREGVRFGILVEDRPLGSIGAAALLGANGGSADTGNRPREVVVVNADNLTSLDLGAMLEDHRRSRAAMTLAVHAEPFDMPFGEITTDDTDMVTGYREKPTYRITVSSAVTVLGPAALGLMEPGTCVMLPDLAGLALSAGLPVRAHRHSAAWVDVNDISRLPAAEALVAYHPTLFGACHP